MLKRYEAHHVWDNSWRKYKTPIGVFPGVTTVLSGTKSKRAHTALEVWRKRVGEEVANGITKAACERGTHLHNLIEHRLAPQQVSKDDLAASKSSKEAQPFWDSMQTALDRVTDTQLIEGTVWHPWGYAGTADAVAHFDGELCLLDWKTSGRMKHWDWVEDYRCQIAAYIAAVNRLYSLRIKCGIILIAVEDAPAQVYRIEGKPLMTAWNWFQWRLKFYKEQTPIKEQWKLFSRPKAENSFSRLVANPRKKKKCLSQK